MMTENIITVRLIVKTKRVVIVVALKDNGYGGTNMPNEVKISGVKKAMAANMAKSWITSPLEGFKVHVDMQAAIDFRKKFNEEHQADGVKVTFNHMVMKAVQKALSDYPDMNARYDAETETMTFFENINVGTAVATNRGLIVANVKDVQDMDLLTLAKEATELIGRCQNSKMTYDDITGGTFTITNMGMMGVEGCFPVINMPELGILGVNEIKKTPTVIDDEIVIRPLMEINLNCDHRVLDGAYGASFITAVKNYLENPKELI